MAFWDKWFASAPPSQPRAAVGDGGVIINTSADLEAALRTGSLSASGQSVTPNTAMRVAAVYACVRIRSGVVKTPRIIRCGR